MHVYIQRKKEETWLTSMTKAPTPTEKSTKQHENKKTATKTSITQRLRTDLERSVEVTAVYERSTFPLTTTAV